MSAALGPARQRARRSRILAFIDLVQDIDVLLPLLLALREDGFAGVRVLVSRWLAKASPRTAGLLEAHRIPFAYVRRHDVIGGRAPSMRGLAALFTAAESSHLAHAAGHSLAIRARAVGARTYVLQHGLECAGMFGLEADKAVFASDTVFCWFPPDAVPENLPAATRAKLVHVGRPDPPGGWRRTGARRFDLGVFENLHWDRYQDADRSRFAEGLTAVARARPDLRILLRPHPAGAWSDQLSHELAQFANITPISTSDARTSLAGSSEILGEIERVITTPSTVALDAALAGLPTALAVPGGAAYRPLPVLDSARDWIDFSSSAVSDPSALDQFRSRVLLAGDGAQPIVGRLSLDLLGLSPNSHG